MASKDATKHMPVTQIEKLLESTDANTRKRGITALRQYQTWGEAAKAEQLMIKHKIHGDPRDLNKKTADEAAKLKTVGHASILAAHMLQDRNDEDSNAIRQSIVDAKQAIREGGDPDSVMEEMHEKLAGYGVFGKAIVTVMKEKTKLDSEEAAAPTDATKRSEVDPAVEEGPADKLAKRKKKKAK